MAYRIVRFLNQTGGIVLEIHPLKMGGIVLVSLYFQRNSDFSLFVAPEVNRTNTFFKGLCGSFFIVFTAKKEHIAVFLKSVNNH